jgi:simple sugar transport system ATP-binding protein
MSLSENGLLTAHRKGFIRSGLIRFRQVRQFAERCIAEFSVKCGGAQAEARSLSGGNLQKFIVGREIMQQPKVLVVAQPTWGVDVGAAVFIRQRLIDLRNQGVAVLVLSEELDELFEICDRLAVIAQGRLSPVRNVRDTGVEEIGLWMSGMWPGAGATAPAGASEAADAVAA